MIAAGNVTCKDMTTGTQKTAPLTEILPELQAALKEKNAGPVILEK